MSAAVISNVTPVATTPSNVTYWVNGRVYCPACKIVRQVVKHPDAIVTCGRCNGPTEPACGDEV